MNHHDPLLFAGSSHPELALAISKELEGPLGKMHLGQFPDGEISIEIVEDVRGKEVFVLQSIALDPNFYLMELLIIMDALKRASAKSIVAIIPYFGYARQDRKDKPGVPITAKLVANLLAAAGAAHLITFDLHADQVEGFFEIPVDHCTCQQILSEGTQNLIGANCVVVAPDIGSIKTSESMAEHLGADLAVMQKQRLSSYEVKMNLIGDVSGKHVLIADDLCSTGGTLIAAANLCKEKGANRVIAAVSHGLFTGEALKKIERSNIESLLITNTIPNLGRIVSSNRVTVLSIAPQIAKTIRARCRFGNKYLRLN